MDALPQVPATIAARRDRRRVRGGGVSTIAMMSLFAAAAGTAQEARARTDQLSVSQQPLEDFDPPGIRAGTAILEPILVLEGAYDSNVFATPNHTRSDFFITMRPRLGLQTEWQNHAFAVKAEGEFRRYASQSSENVSNASVAVIGRVDLAPNAYALAEGSYQLLHEDRGALNPISGQKPTQYTVVSGKAGFVLEPAPLGLRLDAGVDSYAYNDVLTSSGQPVIESARDRVVYALAPRVSYQIAPQYNAFVRAVVNRRQYNSTQLPDGLDRSSSGYSADIGLAFDFPALAVGEVYVGYVRQGYDSRAVKSIQAVDFGGNLLWHPNAATSVRLNLARSVEESTIPGAAGNLQTSFRLTLEHRYSPALLLLGSFSYVRAEFPAISSSADQYEVGLGARYFMTANFSAGLEYVWRRRTALGLLPGYTRQIIGLRLRSQL